MSLNFVLNESNGKVIIGENICTIFKKENKIHYLHTNTLVETLFT